LVVGVHPPNPTNSVVVRYRVDGGIVQTAPGRELQTDFQAQAQYFAVTFPAFPRGDVVEYSAVLTCAGRQVPPPQVANLFPSRFRLAERVASADDPRPLQLEYLASVRVPLKEPESIGVTPAGIMVNWYWYPAEGVVAGPKLNAKVRQLGGDWMTIRRDGVGVMDVRATLETHDGALLFVSYLGHYELGENGYQDFLDRRWPTRAPTRTTPRFHTADPRYLWLNRVQCVGIGEVRMKELAYTYDLYALR